MHEKQATGQVFSIIIKKLILLSTFGVVLETLNRTLGGNTQTAAKDTLYIFLLSWRLTLEFMKSLGVVLEITKSDLLKFNNPIHSEVILQVYIGTGLINFALVFSFRHHYFSGFPLSLITNLLISNHLLLIFFKFW